ncbi:hypothetical protein SJAG_01800 [Schizosaccharomyces japonicus yFS275]|uniref:Uncharacterized protein n=1 Tax=Schizosaccharomyces japonicus (strain yFS275 / FY16936) TaxID=402676 RepID=B6JYX8_SCHJY|nr:hypothetical protein SJAG_01800 [Schizosaccharomyces japonicus yFS275]EEB06746.1 hypothetical protein SJAG_01800 [Schizosaccharomyces japonicus yFS275]
MTEDELEPTEKIILEELQLTLQRCTIIKNKLEEAIRCTTIEDVETRSKLLSTISSRMTAFLTQPEHVQRNKL